MAVAVQQVRTDIEHEAQMQPPAEASARPLLERIESPIVGADADAERRRRAIGLLTAVGGRRDAIETLRRTYHHRLHASPRDFGATEGLRVAERALDMAPRDDGLWAWQRRARQPRRRWRWRAG